MKYYYVYKITNTLNGKIYIGKRYGVLSEDYVGSGIWITRSINKNGRDYFTRQILFICEDHAVCELEKRAILIFKSQDPLIGYNFADGGDGGDMYKGRSWSEISTPEVYESRLQKKADRDKEYWTLDNRKRQGEIVKQKQWSGEKGQLRKEHLSKRVKGENNPSAKTYKIITPTGTFVIKGLRSFCKERDLNWSTVRNNMNKGIIRRKNKKDTSFSRSETKRKIEGWQIIEIAGDDK